MSEHSAAPHVSAPAASSVAHRFGAPSGDAVPRTEHVRVTAPDLQRRAALERTRGRLVFVVAGFAVLLTIHVTFTMYKLYKQGKQTKFLSHV